MYQVFLHVTPKSDAALSRHDETLIGTYTINIDSDIPINVAANAALDTFAVDIPVDNLENITLSVVDDQENVLEESPYIETYTLDKEVLIVDFEFKIPEYD
jgi:hypothetical protein